MAVSAAPAPALGRALALEIDFKHENIEPVATFLAGSASVLGRNDFSMPLKVLTDHWVDTVSDLRLLVSEGQLHTIGLPVRLCMWIEQEIVSLAGQQASGNIPTSIPLPPADVVMEPVEMKRTPVLENKSDDPYGIRYTYVSDFDENGILYSLGTFKGTKPWANPAELGIVSVTTSGLMPDSKPASAVVGREVVRCVTSSEENAWFCIDLIDIYVRASHYTLRHYSSWDTECIRDWKLEGSADGIMWYLLKEHKQDTALAAKGASYTWTISYDDPNTSLNNNRHFYRAFRIMMTGPNSNNHLYMCCSGFELYGLTLTKSQYEALPPAPVSGIASIPSSSLLNSSAGVPVIAPTLPDPTAVEYQHRFDFDSNGIIYTIATNGNTTAWTNPADAGRVKVLASSMMEDSVSLSAVVGQDVVRCVTKPQPKSWIAIDLLDKTVQVTAYTLRHYSSWDTEALRFWRFEASMDGDKWHLLREHMNDEALNAKGATHTWTIDPSNPASRIAYRLFRILQTGENSNKHHYLSLSGFELYGRIYQADGYTSYIFPGVKRPLAANELQFKYTSDFDFRGIIHYLGTRDGAAPWINPGITGAVRVTASSLAEDSTPAHAAVGQEVVRCVTRPDPNSWFAFDLGPNRMVQPTAYSLRHYSSWDTEALRNWRFQGSMDGDNWTTIREHRDDTALDARGATHTWNVNCQRPYRLFRIFQTGHNSNKHHYLALSGFELYGILTTTGPSSSPSLPPAASPVVPPSASPAPVASPPVVPAVVEQQKVERASYQWDTDSKGQFMQVLPGNIAKNTGSSDKWQLLRSKQNFSTGVHRVAIKILNDENTSNTWRFILGVVPATLDCRGPKQWVGSGGSWGYIAGTGGKCHNKAESQVYGAKYGIGDVIGIILDFSRATITFYKNGDSQGVAYTNLLGPVHIAASMTATDSMVSLVDWVDPLPVSVSNTSTWDIHHKSAFLAVDERTATVRNSGSSDKWQSVRSVRPFTPEDGLQHRFDIEILENPKTPNSWQIIVGVVPSTFTCTGSKQWVGAGESWGYIAGTGGKCFNAPKSVEYGEPYGRVGDVITVVLDFGAGTIEFMKNNISQGIAFKTLPKQPVYAAVSLTATGATARLRI